jgi:hypothetical protein
MRMRIWRSNDCLPDIRRVNHLFSLLRREPSGVIRLASFSSLSDFRTAGLSMLQVAPNDLAAASKLTVREVLSHRGCRFHRIYVKLNSTAVVEGDIFHWSADM